MPDDQDEAEAFDDDNIDAADYPPDRPLGLGDMVTKDVPFSDQDAPDSLEERIWRENPDVAAPRYDIAPELRGGVIDSDDPFGPDLTSELLGEKGEPDEDGGVILSDSVAAEHGTDTLSAEESALHVENEPEDERLADIVYDNNERER